MDKLKKYLQDHLEELDTDLPGEAVWQRLENKGGFAVTKPKVIGLLWRYAAAACVLAFIAGGIFYAGHKKTHNEMVAHHKVNDDLQTARRLPIKTIRADTNSQNIMVAKANKAIGPANSNVKKSVVKKGLSRKKIEPLADPSLVLIRDVERNYSQLVNLQLNRLRATPVYAESPYYFNAFKQQLKQISKDEVVLKKEIYQQGLTDELLQQLININQLKLNVLKDLQAEIRKLNSKVKNPENQVGGNASYYLNL